jgi:hypothetical protein
MDAILRSTVFANIYSVERNNVDQMEDHIGNQGRKGPRGKKNPSHLRNDKFLNQTRYEIRKGCS